jgi:hypothetical protein
MLKLNVIRFVDTAGVDPKVSQAIKFGLFSAESNLVVARFVLASAIYQVLKGELFGVRSPCVRKYRIRRDFIVANEILG